MVVVAHVSDPHLDGTAGRDDRLRAVMAAIGRVRGVDAVVVTGDVSNAATAAGYRHARALLAAGVPVLALPGNADDRDAFRAELAPGTVAGAAPGSPVDQRHDTAAATYLLLDSTIPGQTPGRLAESTLAWLRAQLADTAPGRPVVLAMHQPPTYLDPDLAARLGLTDAGALAEVLAERPVSVLLVGHFHVASTGTLAGVPTRMSGAVAWDLPLPWEDAPADAATGGGRLPDPVIAFHLLGDDGSLQTAYRAVAVD